ncbi:MAG TPA: SRPBCC family protein [Chloroflexota bacterium]
MHAENEIYIHAPAREVYELAAAVERWPDFLPHYRWARVLETHEDHRLLEMAARRDRIPLWWCAEQRLFPDEPGITFRHVRGITTGMEVAWTFEPRSDGCLVRIEHHLRMRGGALGSLLADRLIRPQFVQVIASRTLRCFKERLEAQAAAVRRSSQLGREA